MLYDIFHDTPPGRGAGAPASSGQLGRQQAIKQRRHRSWVSTITWAVSLILVVATAACGGTKAPRRAGILPEVQALVSGRIPGALLYVRQGDRSYMVAAGYADKARKVPMRASDTYAIGSTTKTFTAVLIMRLVAQGKLRLDAPISRYLPGLLPDGNQITVRELLSHTSGLFNYEDSASMLHAVANDLTKVWTPAELIRVGAEHPLLFTPGTQFSYSTTGYIVLGLLAQRVGGEPYGKQLRDYIIRPLHLSHTSLPTRPGTLPDVHGYFALRAWNKTASSAPADITALSPTAGWSGGGIRSTVQDVANFYRALFTGKLLPKADVAAMEDTKATHGAYGLGLMPTGGNAYVWGSGTQAINTNCGRAWGHGGHFPGYTELPISSPDGSRQAVLLVNDDLSQIPPSQLKQIYHVLDTAYCQGVPSRPS
jgi:D-alanyl-D-alanine carboxypeptidase